jgi:outer membrane biosynthesis protein TonB
MKQAIEQQWISRLVARYSGVRSSEAVIDFKIQPDGTISDVRIESSEGDPYFPVLCVSSIHDAQPFERIPYDDIPGLPANFKNQPLNIQFTFRYN